MKVCIRYLIGATAAVIALSLSGCASHVGLKPLHYVMDW